MKDTVYGVLTNANSQKINFLYTGVKGTRFVVSAVDLTTSAIAIRTGMIDVQPGAPAGKAIYTASAGGFGNANTLYYGANNSAPEIFNSLFVHEAMHIIFDLRKVTLPWLDSETIAYIAQGFYLNGAGVTDGMSEAANLGRKVAIDYANGVKDSPWVGLLQDVLLSDPDYAQYINKDFVGDG
jgi:hypothetical protein